MVAQEELNTCVAVQRYARKAALSWRSSAHFLESGVMDSLNETIRTVIDALALLGHTERQRHRLAEGDVESTMAYQLTQSEYQLATRNPDNLDHRHNPVFLTDPEMCHLVATLAEEAEHWKDGTYSPFDPRPAPSRIGFLMAMWLSGKQPPPRCVGTFEDRNNNNAGEGGVARCLEHAAAEGGLCVKVTTLTLLSPT